MELSAEILGVRFGYGPVQSQGGQTNGVGILAALEGPDPTLTLYPLPSSRQFAPALNAYMRETKIGKSGANNKVAEKRTRDVMIDMVNKAQRATFARAIDSPQQFRERLVAFFTDHFTTRPKGFLDHYLTYTLVDEAIRPHISGSFADMVTAVTMHPSMLSYLDQKVSIGPHSIVGKRQGKGLNENLARELMELHTLGVDGGYTQDDVRQLAELLTGLTVSDALQTEFQTRWVEPGAETLLGKSYGGDSVQAIQKALRDLALHPTTARHIAGKLAVHFLSDTPDPDAVEAIRAAFQQSRGHIPALASALLGHPSASAELGAKLRQPFDFLVAASHGLGISGAQVMQMPPGLFKRGFVFALESMGQKLKFAPGPDGWPEEADAWVTPPLLAARIDWSMQMPQRLVKPLPDPANLAQLTLGRRASQRLLTAAGRAESLAVGVGIVLSSPEFNRR